MQAMRPVNVPIYDFSTHSRLSESRRVEPADVVIIEVRLVRNGVLTVLGRAAGSQSCQGPETILTLRGHH